MADSLITEVLTRAAKIYAANPSHAPLASMVEEGTECPATALVRALAELQEPPLQQVLDRAQALLLEATDGEWIVEYNANHTTEEVLAVFKAAGAKMEEPNES